tara:strand:+ start:823 stop:1248 length:426 start_codon:yes stop_codon:yes gene_type:complete
MINTIRIPGDFLLTDYKDAVWKKIENTVVKSKEFILCFYSKESDNLGEIANYVNNHSGKLKIKTTIKLWDLCKSERVFLDVSLDKDTDYRFHITSGDIEGIVQSMNFIEHYSAFKSVNWKDPKQKQSQKRNDSNSFDYNKK